MFMDIVLSFFKLIKELRKMLELMDKSKKVGYFLWAVLICSFIVGLVAVLPDFIQSIR